MNIKIYHRHAGISIEDVSEIINTYDEKEEWKEGQTLVLSKYMRGKMHRSSCVRLTPTDMNKTYFAFRGDRKYPSKTLNISLYSLDDLYDLLEDQQTHYCTAVIKKTSEDEYFVITAFWGRPAPKEPGNFIPEESAVKSIRNLLNFGKIML